jgi:hypothetical protein
LVLSTDELNIMYLPTYLCIVTYSVMWVDKHIYYLCIYLAIIHTYNMYLDIMEQLFSSLIKVKAFLNPFCLRKPDT